MQKLQGIDHLFLDLDGTLTDPAEGIVGGIQYALKKLGGDVPEFDDLLWCIGPSLRISFAKLLNTDDSVLIERAVDLYREVYTVTGLFENEPYPGIGDFLAHSKSNGYTLMLATAKPVDVAKRVLEHFKLDLHFDQIYGSSNQGKFDDKAELLAYMLDKHQLTADRCLMIGDTMYDMAAGSKNKIASAGVLWGYGSYEQLADAGADIIFTTVGEMNRCLSRPADI
ncbi:HAD hydrolase-like protein [Pelagibaculum spongiae]|uniref:HAD hydrolase-like protein n=1 Tax=Pelagibaculum spongiae TaxID=2080658 RepID=UPI001314F960|nr:HAD hydrolase-like protein [Pelagibaculum spongiae]